MTNIREPRLSTLAISALRPTQITVGLREVKEKQSRWLQLTHKRKFLGSHMIPVVPHCVRKAKRPLRFQWSLT